MNTNTEPKIDANSDKKELWYIPSFKTLSDWVLRPFVNGLMFGAGSFASKYMGSYIR